MGFGALSFSIIVGVDGVAVVVVTIRKNRYRNDQIYLNRCQLKFYEFCKFFLDDFDSISVSIFGIHHNK